MFASTVLPILVPALFALAVIAVRLRAAGKPTSARRIILPPLGMTTGFAMFLFPQMRIPWLWASAAFLVGACLFAYPLIRTSTFATVGGQVVLQRSKAFVFILLLLLVVRLTLHNYVEHYVSLQQTASLFFILAYGMLLPWRLVMLIKFRRLQMQDAPIPESSGA